MKQQIPFLPTTVIFEYLFFVFLLSTIYDFLRQRLYKPIGFGTYIFVAIGACELSLGSRLVSSENPLPLLGAIVTGIGFLSAGALVKTSDKVIALPAQQV